jgi:hypothetical protein
MKRLKDRKQLNVVVPSIMVAKDVQFIMAVRQRRPMAGVHTAGVRMAAMRIIMVQALAQVIQMKKTRLLVR